MTEGVSNTATAVTLAQLIALRGSAPRIRRPGGRKTVEGSHGGVVSATLGRGLDFAEVRQYYPGDDVRLIDWNVTARSGQPHTKVFSEERDRPFTVVVDLRAEMFFATRVAFKSVLAARLAALLAWAASANRDRVGGMVFGAEGIAEVKPASGSRGVTALLQLLARTHARTAAEAGAGGAAAPDLLQVLQRVERAARSGSSICIISDFAGLATSRASALHRLLRRNHVAAVRLFDPLEASLPPPALYAISDGVGRAQFDTSDRGARDAYHNAFTQRSAALRQVFSGPGNLYLQSCVTDSLRETATAVMAALPGSG